MASRRGSDLNYPLSVITDNVIGDMQQTMNNTQCHEIVLTDMQSMHFFLQQR